MHVRELEDQEKRCSTLKIPSQQFTYGNKDDGDTDPLWDIILRRDISGDKKIHQYDHMENQKFYFIICHTIEKRNLTVHKKLTTSERKEINLLLAYGV